MNLMIAIFRKLNETITKLNLADVLKIVTHFIFIINVLTYSDLKKEIKYILQKKKKSQPAQLLTWFKNPWFSAFEIHLALKI